MHCPCGKPPKRSGRRFCSRDCYKLSLIKKPNRVCGLCGTPFKESKSRIESGRGKWCSKVCFYKSIHVEPVVITCLFCSKKFDYYNNGKKARANRKFCSYECKKNFQIGKPVKVPPAPRYGADNNRWRGGVTPENKRVRESLEYQAWRTAVYERDNYTCQDCGQRGGRLNADHILPFSLFIEQRFDINNGRTLCYDCHRKTKTWGKGSYQFRNMSAKLALDIIMSS